MKYISSSLSVLFIRTFFLQTEHLFQLKVCNVTFCVNTSSGKISIVSVLLRVKSNEGLELNGWFVGLSGNSANGDPAHV